VAEIMRISPHFSVEVLKKSASIKDRAVLEHFYADWRKAGLK
jgi:hypothetical protein